MANLRLRYQTIEFGCIDIHVCTLRDTQQFQDPEGEAEDLGISSASWPLFGVIWPSSVVLAQFVAGFDTAEKRVLEVGCGIALPSLLLSSKRVDISATDHHPETGKFLKRNTDLNDNTRIPYERIDWAHVNSQLGTFDLIIGSDLLYEDQHINLLANFVNNHANPQCEVILVDPGRGRKSKMVTKMTQFGFTSSYLDIPSSQEKPVEFKGHIIKFER